MATEKGEKMKTEFVTGTLIGVRDGPIIVIEVMGQQSKFPLDCELSIEWVFSHMNKRVTCLVEDSRVTRVE
jgi:hypothetical protein